MMWVCMYMHVCIIHLFQTHFLLYVSKDKCFGIQWYDNAHISAQNSLLLSIFCFARWCIELREASHKP